MCGVGVEESAVGGRRSAVSFYPNPASTVITVELPETASEFQISIFNLQGREVYSGRLTEPQSEIDISRLSKGVYIVKLTGDDIVVVLKMIKE